MCVALGSVGFGKADDKQYISEHCHWNELGDIQGLVEQKNNAGL